MELVLLALAGASYAIWRIQASIPTTCTAPLCTQPASLRISVGHEYLPMCAECGIPLLTEGLKR